MTETEEHRIGGILLAAGGSSRFGRPKQLLRYEGKTLIRRAAENLSLSSCSPVVAVLGAEAEECRRELDGLDIEICINEDWGSGMSSSLRAGLRRTLNIDPRIDAVLITLCDQPRITSDVLRVLAGEYRRLRPGIVAAEYNGVAGVPAVLSSKFFEDINKLEGDRGARQIIRENESDAVRVMVPAAAFDIDSPDDLTPMGS